MGFKEIAQDVVKYLGGKENISSVAHCATRLRVMVKDEAKIDKEAIENTDKVMGAFFNSGQYQIIFGTGTVNKVYEEVSALGVNAVTKSDQKEEAKPPTTYDSDLRGRLRTNHPSLGGNRSLHGGSGCPHSSRSDWPLRLNRS